ncbi:hypothetical protein VP01_1333g3 [Puccinia sorghi]|uniref:Uncharacterized protein n=1 Tax=Puccinia sorghi TaxID=27349 RepID=A0A0L6VMY9_9BASI|nr:hypothetical protein VP01_1333g3 [Puccinia sorghi]
MTRRCVQGCCTQPAIAIFRGRPGASSSKYHKAHKAQGPDLFNKTSQCPRSLQLHSLIHTSHSSSSLLSSRAMWDPTQQTIEFVTNLPLSTNPYVALAQKIKKEAEIAKPVLWGLIIRRIIALQFCILCGQALTVLWLRKKAGKLHFFRYNKLGLIHVEVLNEIVLLMLIFSVLAVIDLVTQEFVEQGSLNFSRKLILRTCKFPIGADVLVGVSVSNIIVEWPEQSVLVDLWYRNGNVLFLLEGKGPSWGIHQISATRLFRRKQLTPHSPHCSRRYLRLSLRETPDVACISTSWEVDSGHVNFTRNGGGCGGYDQHSSPSSTILPTGKLQLFESLGTDSGAWTEISYGNRKLDRYLCLQFHALGPPRRLKRFAHNVEFLQILYIVQHLLIATLYVPTSILALRGLRNQVVPDCTLKKDYVDESVANYDQLQIMNLTKTPVQEMADLEKVRKRLIIHACLLYLDTVLYCPPLLYMLSRRMLTLKRNKKLSYKGIDFFNDPTWVLIEQLGTHAHTAIIGNIILALLIKNTIYANKKPASSSMTRTKIPADLEKNRITRDRTINSFST